MLHRTQNPSGAAQFLLFREGVDYDSPMTFVAQSQRISIVTRNGTYENDGDVLVFQV